MPLYKQGRANFKNARFKPIFQTFSFYLCWIFQHFYGDICLFFLHFLNIFFTFTHSLCHTVCKLNIREIQHAVPVNTGRTNAFIFEKGGFSDESIRLLLDALETFSKFCDYR